MRENGSGVLEAWREDRVFGFNCAKVDRLPLNNPLAGNLTRWNKPETGQANMAKLSTQQKLILCL